MSLRQRYKKFVHLISDFWCLHRKGLGLEPIYYVREISAVVMEFMTYGAKDGPTRITWEVFETSNSKHRWKLITETQDEMATKVAKTLIETGGRAYLLNKDTQKKVGEIQADGRVTLYRIKRIGRTAKLASAAILTLAAFTAFLADIFQLLPILINALS